MKKDQTDSKEELPKQPKTELDVKFLAAVAQYMSKQGVSSDRAMSLALGRSENFLNRVRNGYQSATPEAWSALFDKYPEARNITTTNVMAQGGGQAIGTVEGDANYTIADCEKERDTYKKEVEQLHLQLAAKDELLAAKDVIIASKEETINLLRASYNRPN